MEGNVFLLDSRYLNKVILAAGQNQLFSNYEMVTNGSEAYGIQLKREQNSDEDEDISSSAHYTDIDSTSGLLHSIIDNESHVLVPCLEDENIVMTHLAETCVDSFLGCETFVAEAGSESNEEICEAVQNAQETEYLAEPQDDTPSAIIPEAGFPELAKIDRSFRLRKSRLTLSTCYREKLSRYKQSAFNDEKYSIYSGTRGGTRCYGVTDKMIMIPPNQFKRQLSDVSDTVRPLLSMPATRAGMRDLEWSVCRVFSQPRARLGRRPLELFSRNCMTLREPDLVDISELGLLPVGYRPPIDRSKIKRITRKRKNLDAKQAHLQKMIQISVDSNIKKSVSSSIMIISQYDNKKVGSDLFPSSLSDAEEQRVEWITADDDGYSPSEDGGEDSHQIIIIHDDPPEKAGRAKTNLEVLLAAAAEGQVSSELFFCQESPDAEYQEVGDSSERIIYVTEAEDILPNYSKYQIIR